MKKQLLYLFTILISLPALAQKKDSLRAIYVERYPDHFFVWPIIKLRTSTFDIQNKQGGGSLRFEDIVFTSSNATFKLLVGYRFKECGFLKWRAGDLPGIIFNK